MVTPAEDLRVLKETREYFSDFNHWTTGYYGRLKNGTGIEESAILDIAEERDFRETEFDPKELEFELVRDEAVCRCLVGQFAVAANCDFFYAESHLRILLNDRDVDWGDHSDITDFNDKAGYIEVMRVVNELIAALEAEVAHAY